jgi:hypothetical protein
MPIAKVLARRTTMTNHEMQKDSPAWVFQVWASFAISTGVTALGIAYLPVDAWIRAFLGMGLLFTVGSSLSLAKTTRDAHEQKRMVNRITEAKAAAILRDFDLGDRKAA